MNFRSIVPRIICITIVVPLIYAKYANSVFAMAIYFFKFTKSKSTKSCKHFVFEPYTRCLWVNLENTWPFWRWTFVLCVQLNPAIRITAIQCTWWELMSVIPIASWQDIWKERWSLCWLATSSAVTVLLSYTQHTFWAVPGCIVADQYKFDHFCDYVIYKNLDNF